MTTGKDEESNDFLHAAMVQLTKELPTVATCDFQTNNTGQPSTLPFSCHWNQTFTQDHRPSGLPLEPTPFPYHSMVTYDNAPFSNRRVPCQLTQPQNEVTPLAYTFGQPGVDIVAPSSYECRLPTFDDIPYEDIQLDDIAFDDLVCATVPCECATNECVSHKSTPCDTLHKETDMADDNPGNGGAGALPNNSVYRSDIGNLSSNGDEVSRVIPQLPPLVNRYPNLLLPGMATLASTITNVRYEKTADDAHNEAPQPKGIHHGVDPSKQEVSVMDIVDCVIEKTIAQHEIDRRDNDAQQH